MLVHNYSCSFKCSRFYSKVFKLTRSKFDIFFNCFMIYFAPINGCRHLPGCLLVALRDVNSEKCKVFLGS